MTPATRWHSEANEWRQKTEQRTEKLALEAVWFASEDERRQCKRNSYWRQLHSRIIAFLGGETLVWWVLHRKVQTVDPRIEHQFNKVFIRASKEGKEAIIEGWTDWNKCSREEAMRLAVEEWRVQNRSWR
jgi:hypothetical protein